MENADSIKVVETQNTIIRLLSDTVDELFRLLMQHISAEEADSMGVIRKINMAAELKAELEREEKL
jgi:succinate dehydrogenase flavin-adding protein (antitoxin of CptAB toxin-antitoxin module)